MARRVANYRGLGPNYTKPRFSEAGLFQPTEGQKSPYTILMDGAARVADELTRPYEERIAALEQDNKALAGLSLTDELTGLPNRRSYNKDSALIHEYAQRHQEGYTVLVLDLDHFKNFNTLHGHDGGDAVLQLVADTLSACLRDVDIVARGRAKQVKQGEAKDKRGMASANRTGGEEFVILLPGCSTKIAARKVAEKIRHSIEEASCTHKGKVLQVTASIGGCVYEHSSNLTPSEVLKLADEANQTAKDNGRNCVTFSSYKPNKPKGTPGMTKQKSGSPKYEPLS